VFKIGIGLEGMIKKWSARIKQLGVFVDLCERFVARFGYFALFIIMAIPLMTDTVPLYIFSIANREGKTMKMEWFVVVNFIAGVTRAIIFLVLLDYFNIVNLVG
jgi:hypothetical protein